MGFCDPAPDEEKHLRVRFLWHSRAYTATLRDKVIPRLQLSFKKKIAASLISTRRKVMLVCSYCCAGRRAATPTRAACDGRA